MRLTLLRAAHDVNSSCKYACVLAQADYALSPPHANSANGTPVRYSNDEAPLLRSMASQPSAALPAVDGVRLPCTLQQAVCPGTLTAHIMLKSSTGLVRILAEHTVQAERRRFLSYDSDLCCTGAGATLFPTLSMPTLRPSPCVYPEPEAQSRSWPQLYSRHDFRLTLALTLRSPCLTPTTAAYPPMCCRGSAADVCGLPARRAAPGAVVSDSRCGVGSDRARQSVRCLYPGYAPLTHPLCTILSQVYRHLKPVRGRDDHLTSRYGKAVALSPLS